MHRPVTPGTTAKFGLRCGVESAPSHPLLTPPLRCHERHAGYAMSVPCSPYFSRYFASHSFFWVFSEDM